MRHVVVDTSVAVAWVLRDEATHDAAVRVRRLIADGEIEPNVAGHFGFEVRSAVVRAARRGRIGWQSVEARVRAIEATEPTRHPLGEYDRQLVGLCHDLRISWADAHWIALAARLDVPLVTADERLMRTVPDDVAIVVSVGEIG